MHRLCAIIAAVVVMSGGIQSKADDSFQCPVTKSSEQTFVPPTPWGPGGGPWFGTDKLWTRVQMWEYWRENAPGYDIPKLAWFSSTFDWTPEHWPKGPSLLTITGRRLDDPSESLVFLGANDSYAPGKGPFIVASAHVPAAGCWEITGHYKDEQLKFVVKIGP